MSLNNPIYKRYLKSNKQIPIKIKTAKNHDKDTVFSLRVLLNLKRGIGFGLTPIEIQFRVLLNQKYLKFDQK
ncbi:MAG: hypothetical protein CMC56_01280 [Flavobacteriaceae bacterium]|nr:hypothetical protein [Flavobacteriaceae bacterium]